MKQRSISMLCALLALSTTLAIAQGIQKANFNFQAFNVPGNTTLSVEQINDWQTVVGFYSLGTTTAPGPFRGFVYFPVGKNLVTLINPNDVESPSAPYGGFTEVYGENNLGTIVGQYWNSTTFTYDGFFLNNGKYTTYTVPGYRATAVTAINDKGDFAGFIVQSAFPYATVGYKVVNGNFSLITIGESLLVAPFDINDSGEVAGYYLDPTSVIYHGFTIDKNGNTTTIDAPGHTTTVGLGTVLLGLNNFGVVSGHFWDSANNEHGFLRTPDNKFFQVDVPGAEETSGGGLNDFGVMVGHYVNGSGTQVGYIAIPR